MRYIKKTAGYFYIAFIIAVAAFIFFPLKSYAISLTAFAAAPDTDTKVRLDWSSEPDAQVYQLERDDGTGALILCNINVDEALDPLIYVDSGLVPETTYTYTIRAFSDAGLTALIGEKTARVTTTEIIRPYNVGAVYDINARAAVLNWNSSTLASGSVINSTVNGVKTSTEIVSTSTASLPVSSLSPVYLTIQSTATDPRNPQNPLISLESERVSVIPVDPPLIAASSNTGITTISWGAFPQIAQFQLERSKWGGNSWDAWSVVNASISGYSTADIPSVAGRYRYRLAAKSGSPYQGYSNISEAVSALPAPKDLTVSIAATNRIDLSWTNGAGNTAQIQILRRISGGSFYQVALLPASETTYSDTVAVNAGSTYTYRVRAYESASNYSSAAEASISASKPDRPTTLTAHVVSSTEIKLNWKDNSSNENGFKIERMTGTGVFEVIDDAVPADETAYTDNSVTAGVSYIYRICSYNVLGDSAYSNEVTINAWDSIAPSSLTVTPVTEGRLDLAWGYSGSGSYNTIIERKAGTDGTWSVIYTTALGALKYSDTGLSPNTRYFYRVRKAMGTGASGAAYPNNEIGIGAYTLLQRPTLSGRAAQGNTIYLTWSGNNTGADIVIERKMANGDFTVLSTAGPSMSGWYDETGLVPGAAYTYRIKAKGPTNESTYSNELTVRNYYLDAPTELTATVGSDNAIVLNWRDNSTDETGFEIWRYTYGSGSYALYATVDRNTATYRDALTATGVQYYYMVRAVNSSESLYSSYSNTASTGAGLVSPPANLYFTYISGSQVRLHWTDTSNNENGFKLEWKAGENGIWSVYAWLSSNTTSYTVSNLNPAIKYYFRVRAYNYSGNADSLSEEILVSTAIPAPPANITAIALSSSRVKITWQDNSDSEEGFRILRRSSLSGSYLTVGEVGKNITTYTDTSLSGGRWYYYKVVSFNSTGYRESSDISIRTNESKTFSDLGGVAAWAQEAIENLAGMGITKGVSDNMYNPNGTITKAEFTAMVIRAFGFDTAPVGYMADVKPGKWYYREIMIAENFGVIQPDASGRFHPEAAITREEIAVILLRALEASEKEYTGHSNEKLEKFTDKNLISPYAMASMAMLAGEGIMEGFPDNTIGPKSTATRAQAAVFLHRTMNKYLL